MNFFDYALDARFPTDAAGRVVFFPIKPRQGYFIESKAEEKKIRSFLKMYQIAYAAIIFFGMNGAILLTLIQANLWPADWIQYRRAHIVAGAFINAAILLALEIPLFWIPLLLLWRSYKKGITSFTSGLEEAAYSPGEEPRANSRSRVFQVLAIFIGLLLLSFAMVLIWLTHKK
jgi:hypothetical protein